MTSLETAARYLDDLPFAAADAKIEALRLRLGQADRLAFVQGVERLCVERRVCACEPAGPSIGCRHAAVTFSLEATYVHGRRTIDTTSAETLGDHHGVEFATRELAEDARGEAQELLDGVEGDSYDGVTISIRGL